MDALSELLHTVRLSGALFLEARFTAPWCALVHPSYGAAEMLARFNPVVFFHILTTGRCKVRLAAGGDAVELAAGDLILMPQGDTHLLGSDLQLAPVDSDSLMRPALAGGMPTVDHGGGGDEVRFLCGFLSCEKALCRALLDALPRLLRVPLGDGPSGAWLMGLAHRGAQENAAPGPGAGTVLAKLETTEYAADVARAKALLAAAEARLAELERGNRPEEIAAAKAQLYEADAQRQQLLSDWKRKTQLRESKVLTENEYEQAEYQYKAMDRRVERLKYEYQLMVKGPRIENINVARAEVSQAEADLTRAEWRLDNCTIRAPISGTILKKNAEEGNIVNPIAFNGSYSLCDMADLSDLEVELFIQERDIARVSKGQRCIVRAEAYPDREYRGVVSRLMPIADRAKGAVPVRVKLTVPAEEEGVYLKPEMGAIVSFLKTTE